MKQTPCRKKTILLLFLLMLFLIAGGKAWKKHRQQDLWDEAQTEAQTQETQPEETETIEETTKAYEIIPCGFFMYVNVATYGQGQPYYDAEGNMLGELAHGSSIEVLSMEEEMAPFYLNDDYEVAYIASDCLQEEDPGRQIRPITAPSLLVEEAGNVWIHIVKSERLLELCSEEDQVIASYSIGLGGWPYDTKIMKGDSRTPEGTYYICLRNSNSRFYRGLGISYPNKEDAARGYADGIITKKEKDAIDAAIDAGQKPSWSTNLGGEIEIHGEREDGTGSAWDWTAGCISVENEVMDILWEYCPNGTVVIIDP
jgi:hypothetical protein